MFLATTKRKVPVLVVGDRNTEGGVEQSREREGQSVQLWGRPPPHVYVNVREPMNRLNETRWPDEPGKLRNHCMLGGVVFWV